MAIDQGRLRVVVVVGPTAAGKSEIACCLAERFKGEVIGADSRQVYRFMDVATAKPSEAMRARVKHHLIDIIDPDREFDAAAWNARASETIVGISRRGCLPIVCGGTGLYLRTLLKGIFAGPSADPILRSRLECEEQQAPGSLHEKLRRCDPQSAARIHHNDRIRLIRALEVFELTGRPISRWHAEHRERSPYDTLLLELDPGHEELCRRIELRVSGMVAGGLIEELRGLRARYGKDLRAFSAIGYREAGRVLDGVTKSDRLAEEIVLSTRQYAKRQRTWIRAQGERVSLDAKRPNAASELVADFVAKNQGMR